MLVDRSHRSATWTLVVGVSVPDTEAPETNYAYIWCHDANTALGIDATNKLQLAGR